MHGARDVLMQRLGFIHFSWRPLHCRVPVQDGPLPYKSIDPRLRPALQSLQTTCPPRSFSVNEPDVR